MASLLQTLNDDMKTALKNRESDRLNTIRFVLAALKNAQIEAMHPLNDEETVSVLRKQAKMRRDSIDQYAKGGRQDLVDKEEAELAVIESYLPAAPSEDQLRETVRHVIAETGATGPGDMSTVMRATMAALGGQADGRQIQGLVRDELAARGG